MDLYGASYIIDHCVSEFQKEQERLSLEYYVTDTLRLIGQGKYPVYSWREIREKSSQKKDDRSGDEIARDVVLKAGLSQGGE